MEYTVVIFDVDLDVVIMEGARVNTSGLITLLKNMTSLSQSGRDRFMSTLLGQSACLYISDEDDTMRYNITAMKI